MRLTKENIIEAISSGQTMFVAGRTVGKTLISRILSEMLEYKSIEEELGIDLVTLFKAYKDGFHIKYEDGLRGIIHGGEYYLEVYLETKAFKIKAFPDGTKWYFKDYGKTWALTKEELE